MYLNSFLKVSQQFFYQIYKKSVILKQIDSLILTNVILVILMSAVAPSDSIGYFALFSIILTVVKMLTKPNESIILTKGDLFLLVYFLLVLISVAGSSLFLYSFKGFCKTLLYIGFYLSFINFLKDNFSKLKYILLAIALVVFAESFIAIKQNFLSVAEISGWQDMSRLNPEQIMTRVYGSLKPYNPNLFGGYLLASLPATLLGVVLPLMNKHYKTSLLCFCLLLLSFTALLLTGCRGAYIGLFVEVIFLGYFIYKFLKSKYRKFYTIGVSFVCFISTMIILSITSLRTRIFSIFAMRNDSSNSFRFNVYNSCIEMFKDNWLLGIGVGNQNFREIYGLYMKTGFDALSAYNIYLEMAVESGIFSLIAFILFVSVNLYLAFKYINRRKNIKSIYLIIAVISILGILAHGIVDTVFFRPQIQLLFWIMIGVIRVITVPRGKYNVTNRN